MEFSQEFLDKAAKLYREDERKELRNRERRVRRRAERFGWLLEKADPPRQSSDLEGECYRLFDPRKNMAVVGTEFDASLDIIEMVMGRAPKAKS